MRYLALSLPHFAVDLARLRARRALASGSGSGPGKPEEPEKPGEAGADPLAFFLLVEELRGSRQVARCSPEAARRGVCRGMSLAHARALLGDGRPVVQRFDPVGDRETLEELVVWAWRFSPHVAPDGHGELQASDGLTLDVTGSERLFGGEERLLEQVVAGFGARGFEARAATASTIGCAWAVARFGAEPCTRVPAGAETQALERLPTAALRIDAQTVDALAEVGIECVAELLQLPRESLPARFGDELLLRLDQARGEAFEPFVPLRPRSVPHAERSFEAPIGPEAVAYTLREELRELCAELARSGESALGLELELDCAEAPTVFEEIVLSRPHADFDHLWSLVAPLLERVQLGFGAERVALRAPRTAPTVGRQAAAWEDGVPGANGARSGAGRGLDRELAELIDTLASRLGREAILGVQPVESHLPESAFRALPCTEAWEHGGARAAANEARITTLPRPSRLFTPPERVEVETGDVGEPVRLLRAGSARGIVRRFGPERIAVPWWRGGGSPGDRDYFCVQDHEGRWLWLVLDVNGRWFLHGEWL